LNYLDFSSISALWSSISLLGFCLGIQIVSCLFLLIYYCGDVINTFNSVSHIIPRCKRWLTTMDSPCKRGTIFICLFLHTGCDLYYGSYLFTYIWVIGVIVILTVMTTAFLDYLLLWGQISFWDNSTYKSFFLLFPYLGGDLVT